MKTVCLFLILCALLSTDIYSQNFYWQRLPYNFFYGNSAPVIDTMGNIYIGNTGYLPAYGIYRSSDNGMNWTKFSDTVNGYSTAAFSLGLNNKGIIFVLTSNGMLKSTDNGLSWTGRKDYFGSFLTFLPDNVLITAGGEDIYRSTDEGETWTKVYNIGHRNNARSLVYDPKTGYLYVSSSLGSLFLSKDEGLTWNQINPDVEFLTIDRKGVLWGLLRSGGTIARSYDNGASFADLSPAMNWTGAPAFDNRNNVYAATSDKGVQYSSDNGKNWTSVNDGMPLYFQIKYFCFDKKGYLYAVAGNDSVNYSPVFRSSEILTAVNDHSEKKNITSFHLNNNFPNPFNPVTTISYELPDERHVELKVYDVLGRETAVLVNELMEAGSHSVQFNASSLSGGVYIYSIQAGRFRDSKKLVVLK